MPLYKVDSDTADLTKVSGGTLYADLPIGSWVKNDMDTIPSGFLKEGDTISQSEYPELYAKYGSTVPYKADKSELSSYSTPITFEQITAGYTMPYDGVLMLCANSTSGSTIAYITVNGERIANVGVSSYESTCVNFRKGDLVKANDITTNNYILRIAYYTKSLIVKAKHTPVPADFMDAVDEAMSECKILPYEFNRSSNVSAFNRKWLVSGSPITWTATHTGRLTVRCLKHGDGYSLYLTNQSGVMLDSYDNFLGDDAHGTAVTDASITLQAWVKKGDVIKLETNLPASTDWADKYFVQLGLLLYNNNYD